MERETITNLANSLANRLSHLDKSITELEQKLYLGPPQVEQTYPEKFDRAAAPPPPPVLEEILGVAMGYINSLDQTLSRIQARV